MKTPGQLIVFEGADAAGKSSIARSCAFALQASGKTVQLFSFPGRAEGTFGALVYRLHHEPELLGVSQITPTALQAAHIAAHLDAIESFILPVIADGDTVVLDRYWWSTWVYGAVMGARREIVRALIGAEEELWGNVTPTTLFHVVRTTPLREEPLWNRLQQQYVELREQEQGRYPISTLMNDSSEEDAVRRALEIIRSL